jgi:hypothetical protein
MSDAARVEILKEDALGRVERLPSADGGRIRRVACGGRLPFSSRVARALARREVRALRALEGLDGVPRLTAAAANGGSVEREFLPGAPLSQAPALPLDFFDHLDVLVARLHARGVCHNDLHKEQNILVRPDGRPALVDFQLASVHAGGGRGFEARCREDLRHLQKHRRRYTRDGRGPAEQALGAGAGLRRGLIARAWRRTGKPLYNFITRSLLGTRDGETRRDSSGPWPRWDPPLGPPATEAAPERPSL